MAAVSIWRAVINVPVTMVTGSHRTAEAVKVCRGSGWAVGRSVAAWLSNVCILCPPCQTSTSVRSATRASEACASTPLVPTFVRTASLDLDLLLTAWDAKVRSTRTQSQVLTCVAVFDAYLCFQTWTSVLRRTSASVACAPTPKAPTAVPDVRPATGSLLTSRDVKVDPICVHQLNKSQLAHPRSQLIVKIPVLCKRIPAFLHVFSCRYRWVPVFGYVCQWDLSKLRGLV